MLHTLRADGFVWGVARLDCRIFAVVYGSNNVNVFEIPDEDECQRQTFVRLPDIVVHGLKDPRDIVACQKTRRLFIADGLGRCVWIVRPGDGSVVDCIRDVAAYSLSTTYDVASGNCLLVVTTSDVEPTLVRLAVDSSDEPHVIERRPIETMQTANHWHALMTSGESLIVCNRGRRLVDVERGQVIELDVRQRRIVRQFDGGSTSSSTSACSAMPSSLHSPDTSVLGGFSPVYVISDDNYNDGRLIVADDIGNRILVLDRQLRLERVLLSADSDDKLNKPFRLSFDQTRRRLITAQNDDDCVSVFAL